MICEDEFSQKIIVLTGANGGIGRVILRELLKFKSKVAAIDLNFSYEFKQNIKDLPGKVNFYTCDLTNKESFSKIIKEVVNKYGKITNLVNAHGIAGNYPLEDVTFEEFQKVMNVNLYSVLMTCQVCISYFLNEEHGNIISLSSNLAYSCLPNNLPYTLSKSGINALTKTIAKEYAQKGITINDVCPSVVATDMFISYVKGEARKDGVSYEEKKKSLLDTLPQKRWLTPKEISRFIIYLLSDDAKGITGQSLPINMGSYMF